MLRFVLRRLALMVPVLVGLSILLFAWVRALPGDPARSLLGEKATPDSIDRINAKYGFERPLLEQYLTYVKALPQGDLGNSIQTGEPVLQSFMDQFTATVALASVALLFALVDGLPPASRAAKTQCGLSPTFVPSV